MTTVRERDTAAEPDVASLGIVHRRGVHLGAFLALLAVYAAYTWAVVERTVIGRFDRDLYDLRFKQDILSNTQFELIYHYVMLGQRGPATLLFLPYFIWTALRLRSARPLVMLGVALVLLNVSVGLVKIAVGRIGPRETSHYYDVFMGGNIYPSGHVSNAVVLYGLIAWISLRHRTVFSWIAAWIAVSVGAGTVLINTHWFSDVVGGWMAGGLVLLALPWFVPTAERVVSRVYYRHIKHHTDPWVAKLQHRWPALRNIGPHPVVPALPVTRVKGITPVVTPVTQIVTPARPAASGDIDPRQLGGTTP